jgi:hypothetical protein
MAAFRELEPGLLPEYRGKHALMRHGELMECFDSFNDGFRAALLLYPDEMFTLAEVGQDREPGLKISSPGWFLVREAYNKGYREYQKRRPEIYRERLAQLDRQIAELQQVRAEVLQIIAEIEKDAPPPSPTSTGNARPR